MQKEIDSTDPAHELVHETEPMNREERQVEALRRMYGRVLEDETRLGVTTLKKTDAALRGEPADD